MVGNANSAKRVGGNGNAKKMAAVVLAACGRVNAGRSRALGWQRIVQEYPTTMSRLSINA